MENLENFIAYLTTLEERLSTLENNLNITSTPEDEKTGEDDEKEEEKEDEKDEEESTPLDKLFDEYK